MSEFSCPVAYFTSTKHPNADSLGIVKIWGYQVVTQNKEFPIGQPTIGVFIPPDSVVPDTADWAFLSGHRRVRVRKFRNERSEGIVIPYSGKLSVGMDASEELGITKWESPTDRAGQQKRKKFKWYSWRAWYWAVVDWLAKRKIEGCTPPFHVKKYDVENFKRFPVIKEGERVVVTEKIHGANARFVWSSKLGKMCIGSHTMWKSPDQPSWWTNAVQQNKWIAEVCRENPDVVFYGEVFGASVQPLSYGYGKGEFGIRLFDIYEPGVGWAANERVESYWWLDDRVRDHWVPVLYRGPYEEGLIRNLAEGKETISGLKLHIREGVVVETEVPREEVGLGRVKLKIINPAYYEEKAYGNH